MQFDLPLDELRTYRPDVDEPADFDDFWTRALTEADAHPLDVTLQQMDTAVRSAEVLDVSFTGHGGSRISAWLFLPHQMSPQAAVVVEFIGYNGGRGLPVEWLNWSSCGFAHLVVDSRGQGGGWRRGDTPDDGAFGTPGTRGFLTSGLRDPAQHYYSRLFVDAARSLQVPAAVSSLAGRPIVVTGGSQGGALALAAGNLGDADAVLADVPFLSHFRRATSITDSEPYAEIAEYCRIYPDRVAEAFETLSYFDVVNHARRVDVPGLFSVGLADLIAPPSTVFAAYNYYGGKKQIEVYEFNGHEGGGAVQFGCKVDFARTVEISAF